MLLHVLPVLAAQDVDHGPVGNAVMLSKITHCDAVPLVPRPVWLGTPSRARFSHAGFCELRMGTPGALRHTAPRDHIVDVFDLGADNQMIRAHAVSGVAGMTEKPAVWNRADEHLVGDLMGALAAPGRAAGAFHANLDDAVAADVRMLNDWAGPQPAAVSDLHSTPEATLNVPRGQYSERTVSHA